MFFVLLRENKNKYKVKQKPYKHRILYQKKKMPEKCSQIYKSWTKNHRHICTEKKKKSKGCYSDEREWKQTDLWIKTKKMEITGNSNYMSK